MKFPDDARLGRPLTDRQLHVLRLVSYGLKQDQVARQLGISVFVVKYHLGIGFVKLGANNAAHAVAIAYEEGLLGPVASSC